MCLSATQAEIIKATVPVLAEHGTAITTVFYANLLKDQPSLKNVFNTTNQANGHQQRALASTLYAYASHIDNISALRPALELMTNKHASLGIQPEQYNLVGTYLLAAMQEILGDACTPEILGAWEAGYWDLANMLIDREAALHKHASGGKLSGWLDFRISNKVVETPDVISLYLVPADSAMSIPQFKPGQYVSVRARIAALGGIWQARQYSLSDGPGKDYLRISVKRETGIQGLQSNGIAPPNDANSGHVSNELHDNKHVGHILEISHPFGDFFLENHDEKNSTYSDRPLVLISAGIGITPLLSMLHSQLSLELKSKRQITFIHTSRSAEHRPFHKDIRELASHHPNLKTVCFTTRPATADEDFDFRGRLDLEHLKELKQEGGLYLDDKNTHYFVCGPSEFMLGVQKTLGDFEVQEERVHVELFGTNGTQYN